MDNDKPDTRAPARPFNPRAFTSLLTAALFLVMLVTGLVLFAMPTGRIAHQTGWSLLWLDRWQWNGLHVATSVLFVAAVLWHAFLNWKPFVSYLRTRARCHVAIKRECVAAILLVVLVVAGTLAGVPPFRQLSDANHWLKGSWSDGVGNGGGGSDGSGSRLGAGPPFGRNR